MKYDPCVGCGFCCIRVRCDASLRVYPGNSPECPALTWNGERYVCDLVDAKKMTGSLVAKYKAELFIDEGCCCNLNSWRREIVPRRDKDRPDAKSFALDPIFQVFLRSLGRQLMSGDVFTLTVLNVAKELEQRGYKNVPEICDRIITGIRENRDRFTESFMG